MRLTDCPWSMRWTGAAVCVNSLLVMTSLPVSVRFVSTLLTALYVGWSIRARDRHRASLPK
jgi:hypothetical protein